LQLIVTFAAIQEVTSPCVARFKWIIQPFPKQQVVLCTSKQHVGSITTDHGIHTIAAIEDIIALISVKPIDAGATAKRIIAAGRIEVIISLATIEPIIAFGNYKFVLIIAIEAIITASSGQNVVAGITLQEVIPMPPSRKSAPPIALITTAEGLGGGLSM
jgi:hypothetical protein